MECFPDISVGRGYWQNENRFFNKNCLTLNDLKLFKQKKVLTFHYTGNFLLEKILKKIELLIKFGFTSFFTHLCWLKFKRRNIFSDFISLEWRTLSSNQNHSKTNIRSLANLGCFVIGVQKKRVFAETLIIFWKSGMKKIFSKFLSNS